MYMSQFMGNTSTWGAGQRYLSDVLLSVVQYGRTWQLTVASCQPVAGHTAPDYQCLKFTI